MPHTLGRREIGCIVKRRLAFVLLGTLFAAQSHAMAPRRPDLSGAYRLAKECEVLDGGSGDVWNLPLPRASGLLPAGYVEHTILRIVQSSSEALSIHYTTMISGRPYRASAALIPGRHEFGGEEDAERAVRWNGELLEVRDSLSGRDHFTSLRYDEFHEWRWSPGSMGDLNIQYRHRIGGASEAVLDERRCTLAREN